MSKENQKRNHLELRGSIWHVRWDIPKDVRHAFDNKRVMKRSLGSNKAEAQTKSLALLHEWKTRTANVRAGLYDPEAGIKKELIKIKVEYKIDENDFAIGVFQDSPSTIATFANLKTANELLTKWLSIYENHKEFTVGSYRTPILKSLQRITNFVAKNAGKKITTGAVFDYERLRQNYIKELQIACLSDNFQTNLTYEEIRALAKTIEIPEHELPGHGLSTSAINSWKIAMSEQYKSERTLFGYLTHLKRFQKYLNENKKDFSFMTVAEFIKTVSPKRKTQSKYLGVIKNFWDWAIKYQPGFAGLHQGKQNPAIGHTLPKHGENVGDSYAAFKKDEVTVIFDACLTKEEPDLEVACLVLYGVLSGARLEEIGRINSRNTIFENEEPVAFKVEDSKTKSGIREVPIHAQLVPLHKILLKSDHAEHGIFRTKLTKNKTRIDHLGKRFGRLKKQLGFDELRVFHSLRKTFVTELYEQGVVESLIQHIVGHKGNNVTSDVYLDGYSLSRKSEAVNRVSLSLDISKLLNLLGEENQDCAKPTLSPTALL